jgi:hypothetical protein
MKFVFAMLRFVLTEGDAGGTGNNWRPESGDAGNGPAAPHATVRRDRAQIRCGGQLGK